MTVPPRQRRSSVACLIAVLAATMAVVLDAPSASFAELPPEQRADPQEGVYSLMHKAGLTRAQAEQYVDLQERSHGLDEYVRDVAGSRYAGTWLDLEGDRRLKIGLRASGEERDAETKIATYLAERGLAAEADVVATKFSYDDLKAAKATVASQIEDVIGKGLILIGIETQRNQVVVEVASAIESADLHRVTEAVEDTDGAATVRPSVKASLEIETQACSVPFCDRPLRGGASGGPIFQQNRAYGTHVGTAGTCDSLYQGTNGAQNLLNVNIMTR